MARQGPCQNLVIHGRPWKEISPADSAADSDPSMEPWMEKPPGGVKKAGRRKASLYRFLMIFEGFSKIILSFFKSDGLNVLPTSLEG